MSLDQLPPHLVKKAKKELNEDPEGRLDKIQLLREKLNERPDLPFDQTDKDLIRFLRARKFDVSKAFQLMVLHYETRRDNPEIYENFNPSAEKTTFDSGFNITFPTRDQNGCRIMSFRPGFWDPSKRSLLNNLRANIMAMEIIIQEEETQINGVVIIIDFRNFGLTQAKSMNPMTFRNYGGIVLKCYPIRIKGIHVLEQPAIFSVIFAIISQFMKEKLKKRVKLHGGNIDGLFQFVNKEILPSDFGGLNEPTNLRTWVKQVMDSEEDLEHIWT